jgi:peptidoglycan hydrolase CwlO-like protein
MSAIKKLRVQHKNAARTRTPKIMIGRDDARNLLAEIDDLQSQITHLSKTAAEQRIEISKLREEINTDKDEQKTINITGGSFTEE